MTETKDQAQIDKEFDKVLQESAQDSQDVVAQTKGALEQMLEEGWKVEDTTNRESTSTQRNRRSSKLSRLRKKDTRDERGRWFFGGCRLSTRAIDMKSARRVFETRGTKPRWGVVACVILRDQGVCVVCGERLRQSTEVRMVEPKCRGGEFEESNCITVCKHCAECWFPHRTFNAGLGIASTLQTLSVAIMQRRQAEFRGCKRLDAGVKERHKAMVEDELKRVNIVREHLNRSLNE